MQATQSSKTVQSKNQTSGGSRGGKLTASQKDQSSRTRNNTSGGASSGGHGGRTVIFSQDGRNVTPKSLVPSHYQKDLKADGAGATGAAGQASGTDDRPAGDESAGGAGAGEEAHLAPIPPPPEKVQKIKAAVLSKEELERNVDIVLAETETVTLLTFPSLTVALDNPQYTKVVERNKAYDELCSSKADSDQYREQHAQTLNHPHKSKEVFAAPPSTETVEVNANGWDIYDTFATDPVPKHEQIQQACERESAAAVAQAIKKPGCLFTMNEPYPSGETPAEQTMKKAEDAKRGQKSGKLKPSAHGGISASPSAMVGTSAGPSKMLNSTADSLGTGPTGLAGSATAGEADATSGLPGATAAGTDGTAGEDAKAEEAGEEGAETPAPADPMPWKVGMDLPIPEELDQAVRVMERIVAQNVFHKQHMIYRNYPTLEELARLDELRAEEASGAVDASLGADSTTGGRPAGSGSGDADGGEGVTGEDGEAATEELAEEASRDDGSSDKPYLQDLFCFDAPQLTNGMTVTCAEWNRHNQDLLAVSYGDTTPVPIRQGGLVLFWSLKNPTYPERVIRTRHGVTALHFSSVHPNMVAAGTHEGSVMIWDLRRPSDVPVLRSGSSVSSHNDQKHTDIVWETRWVDQGPDKQPPELLVSVSSDGNVLQWSMKKGLEQMLLMQLKRLQNPHLGANSVYGHKEGVVFRKSSGFCVDFPRHDPSTYLVGTEDGLVHRCSTSYNEQYLDTYYGHSGPVYRVRCSPFMSHAFLTCSADWTVKLWTTKPVQGHQPDTPLLTFQSTDLYDAVNDVIWSPHISTSFAAAMDDGRVELWDLSEKPLDPIVVHYPQAHAPQRRRTCVRFSPNSPVLVAGDDRGCVDVMRMHHTNQSYYSDQEQQDRLNAVMVKKR
mmetsp:Transcript_123302/g.299544  ORF Transcript_123302/g.299544 Transcript_123302/m.299544 type:complete len:895 (-) Transcript_123302:131-2815(-)